MKRATLKTLSSHLELSVTTVSRALKDGPEVKPETIARVKQAASELGYIPDMRGVKLRTGRTFTIYTFWAAPYADEVGDAGSVALTQGMHRTLADTPYSIIQVPLLPDSDPLAAVRRIEEAQLTDGMIMDLTTAQDVRARYLLEHGMPFVTFGRTELFTPHAYFDIDNEDSAYQATALLIRRGHRRIALIDPVLKFLYAQQRQAGYRRALAEAGISFDPELVSNEDRNADRSAQKAREMMTYKQPPTGFVCVNEVVTLGVLHGLSASGHQVGDGIDIVSREGTRLSAYLPWPISTCYYPLSRAGEKLASFLLRLLDGEDPSNLQEVAKTELIER
ncbi:MAG: LacI family DNA-binding transcriptional regulator [Pseudomonadota bacterium]